MTENTQDPLDKKPKFRSPNYPYFGLEDAVAKARAIQVKGGLHEVPFRAAMDIWNYKSGTTSSAIAALKAYGLISVVGLGDSRKIKLTESARKILNETSEKDQLLKDAALGPTIYGDLWQKFEGNLPPLDKIISEYLEFEKKFNPDVIAGLIKDFRATIAYANLVPSDIIEIEGGGNAGTEPLSGGQSDKKPTGASGFEKPKGTALKQDVVFNITIDLLENGQIEVTSGGGSVDFKTFLIMKDVLAIKAKHEAKITNEEEGNALVDFLSSETNVEDAKPFDTFENLMGGTHTD